MPYRCQACGYCSSNHHDIVDHMVKDHKISNILYCPICLKVYWMYNNEVLETNIARYQAHLQAHLTQPNKKCNKCALQFIKKGDLKYHMLKDHQPYEGRGKVVKLLKNTMEIAPPKAKPPPSLESQGYKIVETVEGFSNILKCGHLCAECDTDLTEEDHLSTLKKCEKCEFKSYCLRAMLEHTSSCKPGHSKTVTETLDRDMYCVCGFCCSEGNELAKHLATCDRLSAYPSLEAASENTVPRNMLNMLGLVRREDEETESVVD